MEITPELLKTLRKSYENGWSDQKDFDQFVCDEIKRLKIIKNKIFSIQIDIEKKQKEFYDFKKAKNEEIYQIMKTCKHELTSYHADPSGNNDSYYECDICGKEL